MSVGLSWAHVLGDAFAASAFINMWGQIVSGHAPPKSLHAPNPRKTKFPPTVHGKSIPILKRVDPVGDSWLNANNCKVDTNYFHVTAEQLEQMVAKAAKISHFEVLSAIIWKYLSEIREDNMGTRIVTICTSNSHNRENEYPTNAMVLSIVEADFAVAKADISELAELIAEKRVEENEETVEIENGVADYIAYGANLTFVNLEEAKIFGLEMKKGKRPVFANYTINGVGDEGVVLVLPGPTNGKGEGGGRDGLVLTMVLPENQLGLLKNKLERDWNIV